MIEFFLILVVVLLVLFLFAYIMQSENILILEKEKEILRIEKMLKIAEKKFMKGKIKRKVFEEIQDDLLAEKINLEFELKSIKHAESIDVSIKAEKLVERVTRPSRHKKLTIKRVLKETELLRDELGGIEKKFLKHEIKESVFRKLMKEKESQLIRKESEIIEIINEE
ncbi:MAG: hypothetical protein HON47_04205 [Candidatus Diapherotrites archaeon]|uniref:Uncharacterized protein n=1 Tax=Candidatus Iainarchaeum sp. TaxID=3101447 RepID=A0A8T5GFJ0_9ARCH|nr:hypothetical protein [Candidatus Diapherotrites archaeon]